MDTTAIDAVEAALARFEATTGGAVHPLRSIPVDLIAEAVVREALRVPVGVRVVSLKTIDAPTLDRAVVAVANRYAPPRLTSAAIIGDVRS